MKTLPFPSPVLWSTLRKWFIWRVTSIFEDEYHLHISISLWSWQLIPRLLSMIMRRRPLTLWHHFKLQEYPKMLSGIWDHWDLIIISSLRQPLICWPRILLLHGRFLLVPLQFYLLNDPRHSKHCIVVWGSVCTWLRDPFLRINSHASSFA